MTTNKQEVKRYDCTSGGAQHCYGCYTMKECELGDYVEWEAYEALQAECDHYKSATVEITTRHFTERWVNAASNKELEQYLSDGIAQLEGEYRKQIEALQAECENLRRLLQRCEPVLIAHTGASHMTDGFRPRRNAWDELVEQIDAALHGGLP